MNDGIVMNCCICKKKVEIATVVCSCCTTPKDDGEDIEVKILKEALPEISDNVDKQLIANWESGNGENLEDVMFNDHAETFANEVSNEIDKRLMDDLKGNNV